MKVRILIAALGIRACLGLLLGQPSPIPDSEALFAPTHQRLAALHASAQRDGWGPHVATLRQSAFLAYDREKTQAAEAWYLVYRWAQLFGQAESDYIPGWVRAVNEQRVGHANMVTPEPRRNHRLGASVPPELQRWLIGTTAFSAEFFSLLSSVDYLPRVVEILAELHQRESIRFKSHASLALAIALVYDVPPPPVWPHAQVTAGALPRNQPKPVEAFTWWIKQEQLGRTDHSLVRLGASELRFVVDTAAPWAELEWSQQACRQHSLASLGDVYSMIKYRHDRIAKNAYVWPGRSYTLPEILATGGICSDQAYFATQAAKARGVPAILIFGSGNDGRHAWFGYLDGNKQWQLDAGRYAEQRLVTGIAFDPQTWRPITDHDLRFLSERFRELPSYRQSRIHAAFAEQLLADDQASAAAVAARRAVKFERRNQPGWELLIQAARREGQDAKALETILREATIAFQNYPDLEAQYVNRTADSLRARGETSAAHEEVRRIALKNKGSRGDLSVQQAREQMRRAISGQPLPEQIGVYNQIVDTYGRGAGIGFFDEIVVGFTEHLMQLGRKGEAGKAVERARQNLKIEPGSQLAREMERLAALVRASP